MSVAQRHVAQQYAGRGGPSGLADVLEVLLDKGLVIDAYVRVSLIGIELLTVDVRVVVASVDTYLRFAEAVNRLDLTAAGNAKTLGDLASGETKNRRRSSTSASADGRSNGAERSDRSARSADDESTHQSREGDADEHDAPRAGADEQDEDTGSDEDTESADTESADIESADTQSADTESADTESAETDDGPGILSRIKERGQAF